MASRTRINDNLLKLIIANTSYSIPSFNIGEDIESHLLKIQSIFEINKIKDDVEKIQFLLNSLEENAKLELLALPDYDVALNFEDICQLLKKLYFQKKTHTRALINLLEYKQGNYSLRE